MSSSPFFTDEATWYKSLATMYGSAAALITSASGDVLLVKPNYREHWSLPGGIIEDGEPPHVACAREVEEELGLSVPVGPLVAVDWLVPVGGRPRPMVAFLFDGGVLADPSAIVLQESELDEWRFIPSADVPAFLPPPGAVRVAAGLRASASGAGHGAVYVPAWDGLAGGGGAPACGRARPLALGRRLFTFPGAELRTLSLRSPVHPVLQSAPVAEGGRVVLDELGRADRPPVRRVRGDEDVREVPQR